MKKGVEVEAEVRRWSFGRGGDKGTIKGNEGVAT